MRASSESLILSGVGTEENKKYCNLHSYIMAYRGRRKGRNGDLPGIISDTRKLICTNVLTADSMLDSRMSAHLQLNQNFLTHPCQRGIGVKNYSIEGNVEWAIESTLWEKVQLGSLKRRKYWKYYVKCYSNIWCLQQPRIKISPRVSCLGNF